jgi:hypothetical protein
MLAENTRKLETRKILENLNVACSKTFYILQLLLGVSVAEW